MLASRSARSFVGRKWFVQEKVEDEVRKLSAELDSLRLDVADQEKAVKNASDDIRQASSEFSEVMAAMSAAFRDYDQIVSANRELERQAAEAENSLSSQREALEKELAKLRTDSNDMKISNDNAARTIEAHRERAVVLRDKLALSRKAALEAQESIDAKKRLVAASEQSLEEIRSANRLQEDELAESLKHAKAAETAAREAMQTALAGLAQQEVR